MVTGHSSSLGIGNINATAVPTFARTGGLGTLLAGVTDEQLVKVLLAVLEPMEVQVGKLS